MSESPRPSPTTPSLSLGKKSKDEKDKHRRKSKHRRSKSHDGDKESKDLKEIKLMLQRLVGDSNDEPHTEHDNHNRRSSQRSVSRSVSIRRPCHFIADECRKCSEKICLKCKMHIDSCCCGIPNFLFCKECETKYKSPNCSETDPFSCRKCEHKICLACKNLLESCPCPKPNFIFCRMCDAKMRTRCCKPGLG